MCFKTYSQILYSIISAAFLLLEVKLLNMAYQKGES